jgi:RHS repeat-associated protein
MSLDAATGLYFVRARSYDARTGRFVSRDPLDGDREEPETYESYCFNRSNPMAWRDPNGTYSLGEEQAVVVMPYELAMIAMPIYLGYQLPAHQAVLGPELYADVEAARDLDEKNRGRRPVLVRFGKYDDEFTLKRDAQASLAATGNYGVATRLKFRISGTDKNNRWAYIEDVAIWFKVRQTGKNLDHFTVFLIQPIGAFDFIEHDTMKFNSLFIVH